MRCLKKRVLNKKKLKIGLITYRGNPSSGGQGIYINYLSRALSDLGHEVTVISGPPYPEIRKDIKLVKIPSLDLFSKKNKFLDVEFSKLFSLNNLKEWISANTGGFPEPHTFGPRLEKFIEENTDQFDVIHDNQTLCKELIFLQQKIPLVTTIHHPITKDLEFQLKSTNDFFLKLLIKRWHSFIPAQIKVVKKLKKIVVPSESSEKDVVKDFSLKEASIEVVHNGIDLSFFYPSEKPYEEYKILSIASSDVPMKGLDFMIKAFPEIKKNYPKAKLSVLGKIREEGHTERLINSLDLKDDINFVSGLSHSELREQYCSSHLVVIPSLYEGFGFAAAEAMACGVPAVVSDGGSLKEIIGEAGKVIIPGDENAIVDAVNELFSCEDLRKNIVAKGISRVKDKFTWHNAALKLENIYHQMIENHANNKYSKT